MALHSVTLPAIRPPNGNRTIGLGDSITYYSTDITSHGGDTHALGPAYFNALCGVSNGQVQYLRNSGISGNTTAMMLSRIQSDVIAYAPANCIILGGTNDIGTSVALSVTQANIRSMVTTLKLAGIRPILCTITPRNANYAAVATLNAWILRYAESQGVLCLDFWRQCVNATTGNWLAGYSTDNLHPNTVGQRVMAQYAATTLAAALPTHRPYVALSAVDAVTIPTFNPMFPTLVAATGSAPAYPTGFSGYGSYTGGDIPTVTLETGDTAIQGNWMKYVMNASVGGYWVNEVALGSTTWAAGDVLAVSGWIKTSGCEAGGAIYSAGVKFNSNAKGGAQPVSSWQYDLSAFLYYMEVTVPSSMVPGTDTITMGTSVGTNAAGTGTIEFAQPTVINLTKLGLLS